VAASLAALGSVIAASSCCLPLLPFLFAAGRQAPRPLSSSSTLPPRSGGATHCFWFPQVLAGQAMQLQAQQDQHFSFVVLCDCGVCIHLLSTVIANLVADLSAGKS